MPLSTFNDFSTTAASNVDINGITIQGTSAVQNFDNGLRELMAILRRDLDNGMVLTSKSANYTAVANDNNAVIRFSAAATLSLTAAATLGADWHCWVMADGGSVVIDPNSSETINGATTLTVPDGSTILIICNGTAFFCAEPLDTATLVTLTGTQTLTNKTLTSPTINTPTISTPSGEFLRGYINGLTLSNNATDATNDIDIAAGSAGSDGTTPTLMTLSAAIGKRLDATWAAGGTPGATVGGLDTGSPVNGWYYAYLIGKSTDPAAADILLSASATSPTMPSGWDLKRLIMPFWRDAGAIRPFTQNGDDFTFTTPVENFNNTTVSTIGSVLTVTAPPIAGVKVHLRAALSNSGSSAAWLRAQTQTNDTPTFGNSDMSTLASSNRSHAFKSIYVNTASRVVYRVDTSPVGGFVVATEGFTFPR